jgi:uncharacterized surface protein with fasciclin (FAS1) repeats
VGPRAAPDTERHAYELQRIRVERHIKTGVGFDGNSRALDHSTSPEASQKLSCKFEKTTSKRTFIVTMAQPWIKPPLCASASSSEIEAHLEKQYCEMLRIFPSKHPQHDFDTFTVYEILEKSIETTELLKRIQKHPEIQEKLKSTAGECTIWAPTNQAFSKYASHAVDMSEEDWKAILQYHISPYALFVKRLLQMGNMPTLLHPPQLNGEQRLRLRPTLDGIQAKFDAYITKSDIMASNGVIHLADTVLLPPPSMMQLIAILPPDDFSLVQRSLHTTGIAAKVDATTGGTLFIPTNAAFKQLGPEAKTFLFETEEGQPYLKAILQLHFVPRQTLYSNAWYKTREPVTANAVPTTNIPKVASSKENPLDRLRKGTITFPLSTLLAGHGLQVKVSRHGSIISMLANRWTPVTTQDCIANNGVLHLVSGIILPVDEKAAVDVDVELLKSMFGDLG